LDLAAAAAAEQLSSMTAQAFKNIIIPYRAKLLRFIGQANALDFDVSTTENAKEILRKITILTQKIKATCSEINKTNIDWITYLGTLEGDQAANEIDAHQNWSTSGVEAFLNVVEHGREVLDTLSENEIIVKEFLTQNSNGIAVKLPDLPLATFDGNPIRYQEFLDDFSGAVGGRNDLNDKQKLDYLKRSLRGEAQKLVEGINSEAKNYKICLDLLEANYGNKETIKTHLHAALRRLPRSSPHVPDVRRTIREIDILCRQLQLAGEVVEHQQIRLEIESKMPRWMLAEIAKQKIKDKDMTVEKMRKFIHETLQLREEVFKMDRDFAQEFQPKNPSAQKQFTPRFQQKNSPRVQQQQSRLNLPFVFIKF